MTRQQDLRQRTKPHNAMITPVSLDVGPALSPTSVQPLISPHAVSDSEASSSSGSGTDEPSFVKRPAASSALPPAPAPASPWWLVLVSAAACGMIFGFVLHKAGVYRAGVIVDQFDFSQMRMLKVRCSLAGLQPVALGVVS